MVVPEMDPSFYGTGVLYIYTYLSVLKCTTPTTPKRNPTGSPKRSPTGSPTGSQRSALPHLTKIPSIMSDASGLHVHTFKSVLTNWGWTMMWLLNHLCESHDMHNSVYVRVERENIYGKSNRTAWSSSPSCLKALRRLSLARISLANNHRAFSVPSKLFEIFFFVF